ncbi:MAG: hypothetical protein LBH59_06780, partial [Planctomycetaceae bacterium]|nr:hypothetical protein [Planctomycetaceae bacterium]
MFSFADLKTASAYYFFPMIFKIFVQIIFIVLIFSANCEHACCEIFGNIQSRVELVSGLSDRGLFESAEILYLSESKKTDLAHKDKYALASSIVYSRMLQILTATGSERSKLITQLAAFESEFQNNIKKLQSEQSPANSITAEDLELVRLQFRFAVTWYLIGRRLLLESEIADDSNAAKLKTDTQKILLSANTELKKINSYLAAQQNSNLSDQINFLSDNINLYIYLSEIFHTFTTPADNIRNDKLTGLIVSFDNWAKDKLKFYSGKLNLSESSAQLNVYQVLRDCYYLSIRALVEVSLCYRLSGELEKALNIFLAHELKFSDSELPENLRLRIAAERLRFLAASANNVTINNRIAAVANRSIWDTNELLRFRVILSTDGLEYCLAKIEWSSFLARRLNISEAATERMVVKDILTLARQTESKIPSCGYCAAAIIGANDNIATETNNSKLHTIRAIILSELAQDRRERNQIEDAINLFELSGRVSERAGDTTTAIKNAQYAVSLLYDLLNQLEISRQNAAQDITINETMERELEFEIFGYRERVMKLLCGVSRRLVGERDSIELYKRGIDEATILFKAKRLNVDEYILVLSDYWSNWGEASDCDVYKLRVANLLEFNGRFEEALVFLAMIPNDSRQGLDTVLAADRCFKQIHFRNKNKNKNEYKEENIN